MPFQFYYWWFWPHLCQGFPLLNQIISAVSWTWLACGADRFWLTYSQAVLTKPGQMLRCCYFATTSVQRFGGGKADFSSVWSLSQGLFDIFIKDPDDGRETILMRTADHQMLFKCKKNSSLQDNLDLKWSCQLGTMAVRNVIKLIGTTAVLYIKNTLLHKARQIYASRT